jgi:glutaminyl-peptide cyclotransferase
MAFRRLAPALFLLCLLLPACDGGVETLQYEVLRTLPHDASAYTQGLEFENGIFFESTGQYGSSTIRKVLPETGEVLQSASLPDEHFGEGLALVGPEVFQLTWQSGLALVYDTSTLSIQRTFNYEGEGWGLCFDGQFLFMSNGSSLLFRRDPETFEVLQELRVTEDGFSVPRLNELECVGNEIYANLFQSTRIVRIDKITGEVGGELDGFHLATAARRPPLPDAVMNGIAYDPARDVFYLTGKLWQDLFEVRVDSG